MLIFDQLKPSDRPLQVVSILVLAGMGMLVAGLWYHQIIASNRYRADLTQQSVRTVRIPAIRGKILDRNHQTLAENRPGYNINLYLEDLRTEFKRAYTTEIRPEYTNTNRGRKITRSIDELLQREARYRVVSNLLFQVSSSLLEPRILLDKEFHRHYDNDRSFPMLLLKDLSFQQVARYYEAAPQFPSLALDVQPVRFYPHGTTAAHLLGYLKLDPAPDPEEEVAFRFRLPDFKGVKGIELALDNHLRGKAGAKTVIVNSMAYRHSEQTWVTPQPGTNIVLTLDLAIQKATERALQSGSTSTRGAAVVMDCHSGDILAIASSPSFDPNSFVSRLSPEQWAQMNDEQLRPLYNRALYGTYMPGSIFKIIVALACLDEGVLNPNEIFVSKGYFQLSPRGRIWNDTAQAGNFDFRKAFALSSNPYFQNFGLKAGPSKILQVSRQFGLGQPTGINAGSEEKGYLPNPDQPQRRDGGRWMDGDTANLCIGQGEITVTPLQMAVMTAAVANGGKILKPRIVMRLEPQDLHPDAQTLEFTAPQVKRELHLNPKHLATLQSAMRDDVYFRDPLTGRRGSGHPAAIKGWEIAGKTGTAQFHGEVHEYTTWFVSYAPFDNPKYALAIVIEGGDSGGTTCAPVARQIYEALYKRDHELPRGDRAATAQRPLELPSPEEFGSRQNPRTKPSFPTASGALPTPRT